MKKVTIRELRNHGGEVVDRILAGESLTVTRSGKAVAVLHPLSRDRVDAATLLERRRNLPTLDLASFRCDVDGVVDATL